MKRGKLFDKLEKNYRFGQYPMHMPGHKRVLMPDGLEEIYGIDITEIDGFDDLHHPEGIIKSEMELAKEIYGTEATYFLVNGSTCGILAAICSVVRHGEAVLMGRNCHRSVYNAVKVRGIYNKYIMPDYNGEIRAEDVEEELEKYSGPESKIHIKAVVITSPTYEGVVSDIKSIAKICHKHKVLLIVDEAHGAHLLGYGDFPDSAVVCGADIVIQSLHKTLPALTQTALLHVCNPSIVKRGRIEEYLNVFETSSPSYILMASIISCLQFIVNDSGNYLKDLSKMLDIFYDEMKCLKNIKVERYDDAFAKDKSKIVVKINENLQGQFTGSWLMKELRERYNIEMEMATISYVLGMFTVADDDESFLRFSNALKQIDQFMSEIIDKKGGVTGIAFEIDEDIKLPKRMYLISDAEAGAFETIKLSDAAGRVARDPIYIYPPGVPIIAPGEIIDEGVIDAIDLRLKSGLDVINIFDGENIRVIKN